MELYNFIGLSQDLIEIGKELKKELDIFEQLTNELIDSYERTLLSTTDAQVVNTSNLKKNWRHIIKLNNRFDEFEIECKEIYSDMDPQHRIDLERYNKNYKIRLITLKNSMIKSMPTIQYQYSEDLNYEETLETTRKIQQESLESIDRSRQILVDTLEIGQNTLTQIREDTEKITQIKENIEDINDELTMARKQVKSIIRKLSRNRCTQILCIIALSGIIGVFIYYFVKRKDLNASQFIPQ